MKSILTFLSALLLFTSALCQELASKDGLTLTYEATKTETTKKADKWKIKLTMNNVTGHDVYFSVTSSMPSVTLDAQYAKVDIPTAHRKQWLEKTDGYFI